MMASVRMYGATAPREPRNDDSAVAHKNRTKTRLGAGLFCAALAVIGVAAASCSGSDFLGGSSSAHAAAALSSPAPCPRCRVRAAKEAAAASTAVTPDTALSTRRAPNQCDAGHLTFHSVESLFGPRYVKAYFEHLWAKVYLPVWNLAM